MADAVKITFLGGLGDIGRNCAVVEINNRLLLIDVGLMFPDVDMPGVDLVLPDFTYLRENSDRIEAAVITHGHEDHAGALSFLLREISFPIYGSALTLGLARNRIEEAGVLDQTELIAVQDGERRNIGPFDVEFIPVAHSVPNGFAIALHSPQGIVLHTGDFKLDLEPIDGRRTDLSRIGALAGQDGIRLLLSDSTNAEDPGFSPSESNVGEVLRESFARHRDQRIIVACFASHIHRVQQVANVAVSSGRKIATLGRSMAKNVALARQMRLLNIPESSLINIEDIGKYSPGEICVVSTGSQGEPMSALALMASGESKWLDIDDNDVVILSSHPIPGNETSVGKVIDGLYRRGAEVVHSGLAKVHATGHAQRQELRTMISVAKPNSFIPIHGEYRHLIHHSRLAIEMGIPQENALLCEDGDMVELNDNGIDFVGSVPAGYLYVDGSTEDVSHGVLRDRRVLAKEGVVMVVVTVDVEKAELIGDPEIITRGWVYASEAESILLEAQQVVRAKLQTLSPEGISDLDSVRRVSRRTLGAFVNERTRRKPMIVPVVMEV